MPSSWPEEKHPSAASNIYSDPGSRMSCNQIELINFLVSNACHY
jgi:hypothetical protein